MSRFYNSLVHFTSGSKYLTKGLLVATRDTLNTMSVRQIVKCHRNTQTSPFSEISETFRKNSNVTNFLSPPNAVKHLGKTPMSLTFCLDWWDYRTHHFRLSWDYLDLHCDYCLNKLLLSIICYENKSALRPLEPVNTLSENMNQLSLYNSWSCFEIIHKSFKFRVMFCVEFWVCKFLK